MTDADILKLAEIRKRHEAVEKRREAGTWDFLTTDHIDRIAITTHLDRAYLLSIIDRHSAPLQEDVTMERAIDIPMNDCGLSINCGRDGTWLHFTAKSGKCASINVENWANSRDGGITAQALRDWACDRQKQSKEPPVGHPAPHPSAPLDIELMKPDADILKLEASQLCKRLSALAAPDGPLAKSFVDQAIATIERMSKERLTSPQVTDATPAVADAHANCPACGKHVHFKFERPAQWTAQVTDEEVEEIRKRHAAPFGASGKCDWDLLIEARKDRATLLRKLQSQALDSLVRESEEMGLYNTTPYSRLYFVLNAIEIQDDAPVPKRRAIARDDLPLVITKLLKAFPELAAKELAAPLTVETLLEILNSTRVEMPAGNHVVASRAVRKIMNALSSAAPLPGVTPTRENFDELLKALGDLSFECFSPIAPCNRPSLETYNRTFEVLTKYRSLFTPPVGPGVSGETGE